jgi:hypothetical protein
MVKTRSSLGSHDSTGRYLYVFALCIRAVKKGDSPALLADQEADALKDGAAAATSTSSSLPSRSLPVPSSENEFFEGVHLWCLVVGVTGLAPHSVASIFVHNAVYAMLKEQAFSWMVVFEFFVRLLEEIDLPNGVTYDLVSILHNGRRQEYIDASIVSGVSRFGRSFQARKGKGIFRDQAPGPDSRPDLAPVECKGGCKSKKADICGIFNWGGMVHAAEHLDSNGYCKKRHVCNRFVNDKGKGGRCEGDHTNPKCDNPNKCNREEWLKLV